MKCTTEMSIHEMYFFARILVVAASIKYHVDQLRRTTRDLRTGVANCTEVDCGISKSLL